MHGPDDDKVRWLFLALRIPDSHEDDPEALAYDLVAILNNEWPSPYDIGVAGIPAPQWLTPATLANLRRAAADTQEPKS